MLKDKKKLGILIYLIMQTLFLWVFIEFPLQPFPGEASILQGGKVEIYDVDMSLGNYLYPDYSFPVGEVVDINFKPTGWLLLILIVFLTPVLIAFRWSVGVRDKNVIDENEKKED